MKSAVTHIKADIFDLFVDTKVKSSDKKSVDGLHAWLSDRINSSKALIDGKLDTDSVEDVKVSTIKKNIVALEKEISVLHNIANTIEQINTPSPI